MLNHNSVIKNIINGILYSLDVVLFEKNERTHCLKTPCFSIVSSHYYYWLVVIFFYGKHNLDINKYHVSLKIFCKYPTINISKLNIWFVIWKSKYLILLIIIIVINNNHHKINYDFNRHLHYRLLLSFSLSTKAAIVCDIRSCITNTNPIFNVWNVI